MNDATGFLNAIGDKLAISSVNSHGYGGLNSMEAAFLDVKGFIEDVDEEGGRAVVARKTDEPSIVFDLTNLLLLDQFSIRHATAQVIESLLNSIRCRLPLRAFLLCSLA